MESDWLTKEEREHFEETAQSGDFNCRRFLRKADAEIARLRECVKTANAQAAAYHREVERQVDLKYQAQDQAARALREREE